jgi:hypothetical protein
MKCVADLLVSDPEFVNTRIDRVRSRVGHLAFDTFWGWLSEGRERPVPGACMDECRVLAREFRIAALEPGYCDRLDPALEICLFDEVGRPVERFVHPREARLTALQSPKGVPGRGGTGMDDSLTTRRCCPTN